MRASLLALVLACSKAPAPAQRCAPAATAEGLRRPGNGKLPSGRELAPAGTSIAVGQSPLNLAVSGALVATAELGVRFRGVTVLDGDSVAMQVQGRTGGYQRGIAFDGATLYAVNSGTKQLEVYEGFALSRAIDLGSCGWPSDLALAGAKAYVSCALSNQVIRVDLAGGVVEAQGASGGLYPQALALGSDRVYVANEGAQPGVRNHVATLDPVTLTVRETYDVGKNPAALALATDGTLYVAASDDDWIDRVDTVAKHTLQPFMLRKSSSPNGLALDGAQLYVSAGLLDEVLVLDARTGDQINAIPTGDYPTAVQIQDGVLYIANSRGNGSAPLAQGVDNSSLQRGTVQRVPLPYTGALAETPPEYEAIPPECERIGPLPAHEQGESLIKHVVYVLKENKTYDAVFGDFPNSEAKPEYVMWGARVTPNQHELAHQFCLLDNFYVESEQSVAGHFWATANVTTDYFERSWQAAWGGHVQTPSPLPPAGLAPIDQPRAGFVFDALARAKIPYVSYGEFVGAGLDLAQHLDTTYVDFPGNYLARPDTEKIKVVTDAIAAQKLPPFTFVALQWDHTYGLTPGKPTPEYMISDNDVATGRLVEAISKSPYWSDTLILITEDDPSNGADHVDAHRSFALVVSPWAKRGHVSHVRASFPSLAATYERALGLEPLSSLDAEAQPLWDCFADAPDAAPFTALQGNVAPATNPSARIKALDFSLPDRARGLSAQLWQATHPGEPMPAQMADDDDDD